MRILLLLLQTGEERNGNPPHLFFPSIMMSHILRTDGLLKDVIEGKMEGKRTRRRRRIGMSYALIEGTYREMKRRAEDRVSWQNWTPWTCLTAERS